MKTSLTSPPGDEVTPADHPAQSAPDSATLLQPLREVGTLAKTQFWDLDEIYQALREANRLGIAPERFFPRVADPGPRLAQAG